MSVLLQVIALAGFIVKPHPSPSPKQTGQRVEIRAYPQVILAHPSRGGAVRITVRWPEQREDLVGHIFYQYAYPGESGYVYRELDGAPTQFVRIFERMPPGVSWFVAETCIKDTDKCEQAEVMVEVH